MTHRPRVTRKTLFLAAAAGFCLAGRVLCTGAAKPAPRDITIPTVDLSQDAARRVIVDAEPGRYLGQPDTVLLADNRTILVGYPRGHGGPDTVLKRSRDGGLTWSGRLPVPENFSGDHNAPTIHRMTDPKGVERLILIVSHPVMKQSVSEDNGKTWTPLAPMFVDSLKGTPGYKGHAPPKSVVQLGDGRYLTMYHDRFKRGGKNAIELMQIISADGGLSWSPPVQVSRHPDYPGAHPCEPGIIRSPDGRQLLCLARENSRTYNSLWMVSEDEGKTWSDLRELPGSLTGDRHLPRYGSGGRLVVPFRDMNKTSPTYGDFVAWVGTYDDIIRGREGRYRIRLLDNKGRPGDTGYSGLELLPDGTFVSTTYCVLAKGAKPVVVSLRFKLGEVGRMAPLAPQLTDVFVSGTEGYHTFRIPSVVVTQRGAVLAFCEGRATRADHAQNDIVLKRSTDGGRTWGPLQIVAEDGRNALLNPCAVVVRETGRVILMIQRYPEGVHTNKTVPGYEGDRICRTFLITSDDDGRTWMKPREITRMVKRPTEVTATPVGPGIGIQLRRGKHAGRILMPFVNQIWPRRKVCAVFSDDLGRTWTWGEWAPEDSKGAGAEVALVELADGSVMMNTRSTGGNKRRKVATSTDGGVTWSPLLDDPALIEPQCQGTILRYSDPLDGRESRILFANPVSQEGRENGTVRLSLDEGKTWPVSRVLYPGAYAYSCLTVLPEGTIGCLFERDGYKRITFARFTLEWLTGGAQE